MSSFASRVGGKIASALGVNVTGGQIIFSDAQVSSAQNMVRKMLTSSGGGKSVTSMKQNFQIFGIPILEVYGFKMGAAISAFAALFLFIGWKMRGRNVRNKRR